MSPRPFRPGPKPVRSTRRAPPIQLQIRFSFRSPLSLRKQERAPESRAKAASSPIVFRTFQLESHSRGSPYSQLTKGVAATERPLPRQNPTAGGRQRRQVSWLPARTFSRAFPRLERLSGIMRVNSPVHSCGYSRSLAPRIWGLLRSLFASFRKTVTTGGIEAERGGPCKGKDSRGIPRGSADGPRHP